LDKVLLDAGVGVGKVDVPLQASISEEIAEKFHFLIPKGTL